MDMYSYHEGEEIVDRGFASLLLWVNNAGVSKRGVSPSFQNLPLPLIKGKGTQGIGSPNKNLIGDRFLNNLFILGN